MFRWLGRALSSSIGRKALLAVTGLLLVGFLVEHVVGNLNLYRDEDGAAFDAYKHGLEAFGPLLTIAEIGLFALFAVHIGLALKLQLENREARPRRYVVRNTRGRATAASLTMAVTGLLLLVYLVKHVGFDFRFVGPYHDAPAETVKRTLASPGTAIFYIVMMAVLGLHLAHGFRSAFQSIGASHPKANPLLEKLGIGLAVLLAVGFASFPVYYCFFWSGGAE